MLVDARGEMLGGAPPESARLADECLMDARKKIEHEIESKAKASLKEGLGQELKTPHPGTNIEDEEGNPGSDRNEEGRHQCVEDTDLDERGYDVEITDTEASDDLLYEEVLTVLMNEDMSDDQIIHCFLVVALSTFLCPTSNTKPSTKYMGALVNVEQLKQLNWCRFVHDWELMYIKKYQKEKLKQNRTMMTLGGCIYHLAVRCLDFTDFGSIQIPSLMPRICVWKGDMVKHLSDMTIGRDGKYGCLTIKEVSETRYKDGTYEWASTIKNSNFRKAINNVAGNSLSDKVKEDIFLAYENHMKNEDINTCIKAKGLLLDTIRIITNASGESGDTVKVGSTGTELNASQQSNNSGDTVKLQSTELQEENDGGHLLQRKTDVLSTSQQSAGSSASKTNAGKGSINEANGFCSSPPKVHEIGKLKSDSRAQCQREHSSKDPMPEMCVPAASTFAPGNHVDGGGG
ncbi:uncharacterized protein LOC119316597 isoform X4 [Triticum dicoccoides]|uniref:uncharacterized protein LOC119316597 isoform X4 n=1 Tax=Triticum dicoccoides TaxID=85692 RepID=UPI0018915C6D|nr:uncharacterized protein LOC119316597 isoform X4 [Triticum dicoccoides]